MFGKSCSEKDLRKIIPKTTNKHIYTLKFSIKTYLLQAKWKSKMSYEELLKRARSQLPSEISKHKRLEIPKPRSFVTGLRTILVNFKEICDILNREPRHLLKFLSGEMATAANIQRTRATFQGRFYSETFERLIQRYIKEFVVCPVCKRPDTKLLKEKRFQALICEACGAKSSISAV